MEQRTLQHFSLFMEPGNTQSLLSLSVFSEYCSDLHGPQRKLQGSIEEETDIDIYCRVGDSKNGNFEYRIDRNQRQENYSIMNLGLQSNCYQKAQQYQQGQCVQINAHQEESLHHSPSYQIFENGRDSIREIKITNNQSSASLKKNQNRIEEISKASINLKKQNDLETQQLNIELQRLQLERREIELENAKSSFQNQCRQRMRKLQYQYNELKEQLEQDQLKLFIQTQKMELNQNRHQEELKKRELDLLIELKRMESEKENLKMRNEALENQINKRYKDKISEKDSEEIRLQRARLDLEKEIWRKQKEEIQNLNNQYRNNLKKLQQEQQEFQKEKKIFLKQKEYWKREIKHFQMEKYSYSTKEASHRSSFSNKNGLLDGKQKLVLQTLWLNLLKIRNKPNRDINNKKSAFQKIKLRAQRVKRILMLGGFIRGNLKLIFDIVKDTAIKTKKGSLLNKKNLLFMKNKNKECCINEEPVSQIVIEREFMQENAQQKLKSSHKILQKYFHLPNKKSKMEEPTLRNDTQSNIITGRLSNRSPLKEMNGGILGHRRTGSKGLEIATKIKGRYDEGIKQNSRIIDSKHPQAQYSTQQQQQNQNKETLLRQSYATGYGNQVHRRLSINLSEII